MKKLVLLFIIPLLSFGQIEQKELDSVKIKFYTKYSKQIDSLNIQLEAQQNLLSNVIINMNNHHGAYKGGMLLNVSGIVLTALGGALTSGALLIVGPIMSFVGSIIVWDSDKYFGFRYTRKLKWSKTEKIVNDFLEKEVEPQKELHTKEEIEQVQNGIKKLKEKKLLEVCDCTVVLEKSIDPYSHAENVLYGKCKKLLRQYRVNTHEGLKKWKEDAKKGGCL